MNFNFIGNICRWMAFGAILLSTASCVDINEELGENFIPTDQLWDVFIDSEPLEDIILKTADSLSAYSSTRITVGAINDGVLGTTRKASSFTLVPVIPDLNLGENTVVRQFHFNAVRDTLSTMNDNDQRMLQNIYVYSLKNQIDSTLLYTNSFTPGIKYEGESEDNRDRFIDFSRYITAGIPVYSGGDSLSFNFSKAYAEAVVQGIKNFQKEKTEEQQDSIKFYLEYVPGIYMECESPVGTGGRINMFDLPLEFDDYGYVSGNYAELKITADYDDRKQVDTSFIFIYGPSSFVKGGSSSSQIPTQYSFNTIIHDSEAVYSKGVKAESQILVEGGSGVKPVIKASGIKEKLHKMIAESGISNPEEVVINKATITLPYNVNGDWDKLDKYPVILSPTVRLHSNEDRYVSYAGLTDSSIESENQGDINISLSNYAPDISHHVQEILKLKQNDGESTADYEKRVEKYDIWMLIMANETTTTSSGGSSYDDYYNNLLYSSYYNNMMYDPYGYGYGYGGGYGGYYGGYGYGGYGYDSYGYGYGSNYYNYLMMAQYASASSGSTTSVSTELDRDRFYSAILNGPADAAAGDNIPMLSVTFAAPKTAEAK